MARDPPADFLQGTLDLLVLRTLALAPIHGWDIARHIQQQSRQALAVGRGSVYLVLLRLQQGGLIEDEWGVTENNRRALGRVR